MRVLLALLFFISVKIIAQVHPTLDTFNLRNGLKVYLLNYGQDSVLTIKLVIDGGQKNETSCQVGYSEIIQHLLTETLKEKQKTLFKKRKKIHCEISEGQTLIYGNCFMKDFSKYMNLLSSSLLKLPFKSNTLDRVTAKVIDSYSTDKVSVDRICESFGALFLYGSKNPLGRHYCQYAIQKVLPFQLRDFYYEHYNPKKTSLIICGNFDKEEIRKYVARYFNRWKSLRKEQAFNEDLLLIPKIKTKTISLINKRDQKVFHFNWRQNAPTFKSPDYKSFQVTTFLFDLFAKEILNDSINFHLSYSNNLLELKYHTEKRLNETISLFDSLLFRFQRKDFTDKDFQNAITVIRERQLLKTSTESVLNFYDPLVYNFDSRKTYFSDLSTVSKDDINHIRKNYFSPTAYKLTILGREGVISDQLSSGKVIKYQATDFQTCDETCVPPKERLKPHCEQARLFCRDCWKLGRFWGKNRC